MVECFLAKYFRFHCAIGLFSLSLSFVNDKKKKEKRLPSKILYVCIKVGQRKKENHA